MDKLELGNEAKDKITGFQGIVTGIASYLTGCNQLCVQPQCEVDKGGTYPSSNWFDEGRLEFISKGIESVEVTGDVNGCDYEAPSK